MKDIIKKHYKVATKPAKKIVPVNFEEDIECSNCGNTWNITLDDINLEERTLIQKNDIIMKIANFFLKYWETERKYSQQQKHNTTSQAPIPASQIRIEKGIL